MCESLKFRFISFFLMHTFLFPVTSLKWRKWRHPFHKIIVHRGNSVRVVAKCECQILYRADGNLHNAVSSANNSLGNCVSNAILSNAIFFISHTKGNGINSNRV